MAVSFIRGRGIRLYFKEGFNIVRRHQRGEHPNDNIDLFEYLGSSKSRTSASKQAKKLTGKIEIMEFKHDKEE